MEKTKSIENVELLELKQEAAALESQLTELVSEKTTKEKLIQEYNQKFNSQVGDLLKKVYKLRLNKRKKEALLDPSKKETIHQAQKEYDEFNQQYEEIKSKQVTYLSDEDKELLKKNFRKACQLCHPDVVADEFKNEATRLFTELQQANESNDLLKVNEILALLENELKFPTKSEKVSDKDRLKLLINHLRIEVQKVEEEVIKIKESEIYKHVTTIGDWDVYFLHLKKQLEQEAISLEKYLSEN